MKHVLRLWILPLFMLHAISCLAQVQINGKDCSGIWKTIDDNTGRDKSHVEISRQGDKYVGKIVRLLDPADLATQDVDSFADLKCRACPEARGKDQPLLGLQIVWGMQQKSNKLASGEIMDPENGKIYGCSIWLDEEDPSGNTLKVRGWLAFLYRTQTWHRVDQ